jgi:phage FluMu protein Com
MIVYPEKSGLPEVKCDKCGKHLGIYGNQNKEMGEFKHFFPSSCGPLIKCHTCTDCTKLLLEIFKKEGFKVNVDWY